MTLRTFGGLELADAPVARPKALLLLAYLALEGPASRRFLADLFWPGNPRARRNLAMTLTRLRAEAPGAFAVEGERVVARVETDAAGLVTALSQAETVPAIARALEAYQGPFLDGVALGAWGVELEEWVYARRDFYRGVVRDAHVKAAEMEAGRGDFRAAAGWAEGAARLADDAEPGVLRRVHTLLVAAGSPFAKEMREALATFGPDAAHSLVRGPEEARGELRATRSAVAGGSRAAPDLPPVAPFPIGRDRELEELADLLASPDARLLTLVGPAGVGKSLLALAAAHRLRARARDGREAYVVSLASESTAERLAPAIAEALSLADEPGRSALQSVTAFLRGRPVLLILDNLEQIEGAASFVAKLVAACPELTVLATSRVPLYLSREREYPVPPLDVPPAETAPDPPALARVPAVAMFLARVRAVRPSFALRPADAPAVSEICRRLDGLPLALELAAARIKLFTPQELRRRLDQRLDLLAGAAHDAPARHRTLRAALDWSYELLTESEAAFFRAVAVFVEGFDFEAAEGVGRTALRAEERTEDLLTALVDKGLVRADVHGGRTRFRLLETIRAYAEEHLARAGEGALVRRAHARHYAALAERAAEELTGAEAEAWLDLLALERGNLRAALAWADAQGDPRHAPDPELAEEAAGTGLRLAVATWRFWVVRGPLREGRAHLSRFLERAQGLGRADRHLLATALRALGTISQEIGDFRAARSHLEQALELATELRDEPGRAAALNHLGWVSLHLGDVATAERRSRQGLEKNRELGAQRGISSSLNNLGWAAMFRGDAREAQARFERSLGLREEVGDVRGSAFARTNLAWATVRRGELAVADTLLSDASATLTRLNDEQLLAWTHTIRGALRYGEGRLHEAGDALEQGAELFHAVGNQDGAAHAWLTLADVRRELGDLERASLHLARATAYWRHIDHTWGVAASLEGRGRLEMHALQSVQASVFLRESLRMRREMGDPYGSACCLEALAWSRLPDGSGNAPPDEEHAAQAARFLAVADRLRARAGTPLLPRERQARARMLQVLRRAGVAGDPRRAGARVGRERLGALIEAGAQRDAATTP